MRILELGKFYPPTRGGIETLLKSFCEGFVRKGAEVNCVVANTAKETIREKINGALVARVRSFGMALSTSLCPGYAREAKAARAAIWHAHFPNPLADFAVLRAPKDAKVVISYHSDIIRQAGLMAVYGRVVERCLKRADRIVVATPRHLEFSPLLQRVREKVVVIPYGLDAARFERAAASRVGQRPILLTVGRLVGYKGHRFLIEAMKNLDGTLWIVGTGPLESELRRQVVEARLGNRVEFMGDVADEELPKLYQRCDLFVLPSITRNEAFGMVQLEAMTCGKPVISCDLKSGVPWVNQHEVTGLIVPPGDAPALAAAVERFVKNPELAKRFGEAGRKRALSEFSEQQMVDSYYKLFEGLLH